MTDGTTARELLRNLLAWGWDNLFTLRMQNLLWDARPELCARLDQLAFERDARRRSRRG